MKKLLVCCIMTVSCGYQPTGLVIKGQYDMDMVEFTFNIVEQEFNKFSNDNIDLYQVSNDFNLEIFFWQDKDWNFKINKSHYVRGEYIINMKTYSTCYENYTVLGHELLHFLAEVILINVSAMDNRHHNIPGYFINWEISGYDNINTIEYNILKAVRLQCDETI